MESFGGAGGDIGVGGGDDEGDVVLVGGAEKVNEELVHIFGVFGYAYITAISMPN